MKQIFLLIMTAILLLQVSCRKDPDMISTVVDVTYPKIELKGEKFVTLNVGQAYEDPGATATDDISGAKTEIMAYANTLDVNTPGLYYMGYTAKNSNGYVRKVARYIAVTNYQDDIDLTGTYYRAATDVEVEITKVSRALYRNSDMGGAGLEDAAYFVMIDDATFDVGLQLSESIGEEIDGFDELLEITDSSTVIQYSLDAPGYGTAPRIFTKVQ